MTRSSLPTGRAARGAGAAAVLPLLLVACGGGRPSPAAPVEEATSPSAAKASTKPAWSSLDRGKRLEYMGLEVFPRMKQAFQRHDASAFEGFRCQTCHGDGFDGPAIDFRMPNPALPPLSATDPIGGAMAYAPETAAFMRDEVVPTMAELLGTTPYDPATGEGFGCFGCHPKAGPR